MNRPDFPPLTGCFGPGQLKKLAGEFQLLLQGGRFVEFLRVCVVHIVAPGRLVYAGDSVQVAGDELPAEEEGIVCTLRQIVIADAEIPGVGKAAVAVEADVALKQHRAEAQPAAFSRHASSSFLP